MRRAYRRLRRRMDDVDEQPAGDARDRALHEARKAAKRLRYAAEAAEPAVGKPAKRLRKRLKPMQSVLGDHQDAVVARPVLRELGAQVHQEGGNGFTFGLLHAIESDRAAHAERRLPDRWAGLQEPEGHRLARLTGPPAHRRSPGNRPVDSSSRATSPILRRLSRAADRSRLNASVWPIRSRAIRYPTPRSIGARCWIA